ncbi:rifin [Plasmodium reichenowi]|uniref:Rifin n=1 Tax=Plasmodium reichenowi TaxID=5854 RepID=A0A060RQE2_PLARE|nr:rifin [Plasmodium reichenowi]
MKVHYINILLFALPLNILVNTHKKPYITPKIPTTRLLCECELYAPGNYDNDPQMKAVMQQFEDRTSERLRDYDDRMKTTRQKCKEQCDKEIQKIILKDKLEKQMAEQLTTLETKITTDHIPTCACEKSLADKMEKGCLRCGYGLGTVAPTVGLIGSVAVNVWKTTAIAAAKEAALAEGAAQGLAAGNAHGMNIVIYGMEHLGVHELFPRIYQSIRNITHYTDLKKFAEVIIAKHGEFCNLGATSKEVMCKTFDIKVGIRLSNGLARGPPAGESVPKVFNRIVGEAIQGAAEVTKTTSERVAAEITAQETNVINTLYMGKQTAIIASIVAIVVIILIMVIIYLILRYRRKKKMKKKLQYIKLLEE